MSQETILQEIRNERAYQDRIWSGASFDDQHSEADWLKWIDEYAKGTGRAAGRPFRQRMVKVAALCVAAMEAYDRKPPQPAPAPTASTCLEPGEVLDVGALPQE